MYKTGDKSKVICSFCSSLHNTTFKERSITLGKTVLVGVCDNCDNVVSIPQQSVEQIEANRQLACDYSDNMGGGLTDGEIRDLHSRVNQAEDTANTVQTIVSQHTKYLSDFRAKDAALAARNRIIQEEMKVKMVAMEKKFAIATNLRKDLEAIQAKLASQYHRRAQTCSKTP